MFNEFCLNKRYSFNLQGDYFLDGNFFHRKGDGFLDVEVEGKVRTFSIDWISNISHYEVNLPLNELVKIQFVHCDSKVLGLKSKNLMTFTRKIETPDGFFLIPGFTRFCLNTNGVVKSTITSRILKPSINPYGYPYVNLYDPDKKRWRSVCLHILIARVFVKNPDPSIRIFVNHKDGDKCNFKPSNLEWVTSLENQLHAVNTGLRRDNNPCKVLDIQTNNITRYQSLTTALKAIGMTRNHSELFTMVGGEVVPKLFFKRYEIKFHDDETEWFYKNRSEMKRKLSKGPFEAKNIVSGEIIETKTIRELSRLLYVSASIIENCIKSPIAKANSGFLFRIKSEESWPENFVITIPRVTRAVKLTNVETGEVMIMDSILKTCKFLGIDKRTLKLRIMNGRPYKNWFLKEV